MFRPQRQTTLRGTVLIAALMANCGIALGQNSDAKNSDAKSANYIISGCRSAINDGVDQAPYLAGLCSGKVQGLSYWGEFVNICPAGDVTNGQMIKVVVQYIDSRPDRLQESFFKLATEALRAAWPCKR